ncbi:MAG: hypothetical protein V1806_13260 [Pseudomonadota bacterium]
MLTQAGRPAFFGGGPAWVFYVLAAAGLLLFIRNLRARLRCAPDPSPGGRPWLLPLGDGPRAPQPVEAALLGLLRAALLVLALGSLSWNLHRLAHPFLRGQAYLVFALTLEVAGGLLLLALLGLAARRATNRAGGSGSSWVSLGLLLWVTVGGFFTEYARLAATRPDWAGVEFLGWLPVRLWSTWGGPSDAWLLIIWWAHALPALLLVAWLPRMRL